MKAIKTEFAAEWKDNGKWIRAPKERTIAHASEHAFAAIGLLKKHRIIKIVTFERESVLVAKQ